MSNRLLGRYIGGYRRGCAAAGLVLIVTLGLGACATGPDAVAHDPLEPMNRSIYRFNEKVDSIILKPVATAYKEVTPRPVRSAVGNFFGNLKDLWSSLNAAMQLRPREAAENFMRFNLNTVFGFLGLIDIATEAGIPRTETDFGQTLGRWGVPAGPYLVLPFLGPSSGRDLGGLVVDSQGDLLQKANDPSAITGLTGLKLVDKRANLLRASTMLDDAALDPYSFLRDAYLQRRQNQVQDMIDQGIGPGPAPENPPSTEADPSPAPAPVGAADTQNNK
jgi:phospholipid-binding lipoprotein MlaA